MANFTVEAILKAVGADEFARAFKEAQDSVKSFEGAGQKIGNIGSTLTKSVTLPLLAMGAGVMKVGSQYEASMSSVQAISGATGDDLDKLKATAREMGATTRYSASESADALGFMALAGWDVEQMTSALPGVLNLATAGNLDLAKASDIVTDTMSMFGMEAQDAGKASDIFAAAQSKSNTNVEQLSEALLNAGPAAAAAGADLEQTSAILGMFANQGVKGGRAGTTLNAMFRDLKAGAEDGAIAIGESQVAVYDANGEMRNMSDIMKDVESATSGLTGEQKDAALAGVFQQQSLTGVNLLLAAGSEELATLEGELYNSSGTAENMAKIMDDNLGGAMANMRSALEEVALGFFDLAGGPMTTFIQKITELLQWFGKLNGDTKQWILIIAGVVAAIGPVLLVVSKLIGAISAIPVALGLLTGPVGIVIAGIAAVVAIGVLLYQNLDMIKERAMAMFDALFPNFDLFKTHIQGLWEVMKEAFSAGNMDWAVAQIRYMLTAMINYITTCLPRFLNAGLDIVTKIITGLTTKIPELLAKGLEMILLFVTIVADAIPKLLRLGADFIISLLRGITEKMPEWIAKGVEMVVKMAQTLGDNLPKILEKGRELLVSVASGFKEKFPEIVAAAFGMITTMLGEIARGLPKLLLAGAELILKLVVGIIKSIPDVLRAMSDISSGIKDAVSNISLADAGRAIIGGFIDGMKGMWEGAKGFISGIAPWIKDNKGPISYDRKLLIGAGEAIMGGLDRGLQDSFGGVKNTVLGVAGSIQDLMQVNPTVDIGGQIAQSNGQVNAAISHNMNMGDRKRPMQVNLSIGGRNFNAFVEDVSNNQDTTAQLELAYL